MCYKSKKLCYCCDAETHHLVEVQSDEITNTCGTCGGIRRGHISWADYDCNEMDMETNKKISMLNCPFCTKKMEPEEPDDFHHWYCKPCDVHFTIRPWNDGMRAGGK